MLLKKTPNKQSKQETIKGIFVPKEKRVETRNEVSRAHFTIGAADTKFPAKSFSHDHFGEFDVQANKVEENKKISSLIKKSHFNIGGSRQFQNETTHTAAFNQSQHDQFKSAYLNQEFKNDLRKAHFKFGNDSVTYQTTNKQAFVNQSELDPKSGGVHKQAQEERKQKMRTQNFVYGKDVPQYQSMAKKDFPTHNSHNAVKNLQQSKLNGTELRKSHFMFGSDATPFKQQPNGMQVQQDQVKQSAISSSVILRRNNFQLNQTGGGDFFVYETVNGTQMSQVKTAAHDQDARKNQELQMMALKQDLRQAHFNLGNHQPQYESSYQSGLQNHDVGNTSHKEAQELSKQMQKVSFQIGDDKKRDLKDIQSTYKQSISGTISCQNALRPQAQLGLRNSNFHFGSEKQINYVSESKEKFQTRANELSENNNKELSKQLKAHHFTIAETNKIEQPKYYESVNKQDFNYKGEARLIRGCIAQEVKDDLRSSHFKVGYQPSSQFGNAKSVNRPASAFNNLNPQLSENPSQVGLNQGNTLSNQYAMNVNQRPYSNAGDQNKASHVFNSSSKNLGQNQYQTSNQSFFRWIQPSII